MLQSKPHNQNLMRHVLINEIKTDRDLINIKHPELADANNELFSIMIDILEQAPLSVFRHDMPRLNANNFKKYQEQYEEKNGQHTPTSC